MKDRRSGKRVNVNLKAIMHNGDEVARARISNISKGDLFLWTQFPDLRPGTDIEIDIDGENVGVFGVTGYVVRRCPLGKGLASHKDCESGTISSWNDSFIFVNYGKGTNAATYPRNLVWG